MKKIIVFSVLIALLFVNIVFATDTIKSNTVLEKQSKPRSNMNYNVVLSDLKIVKPNVAGTTTGTTTTEETTEIKTIDLEKDKLFKKDIEAIFNKVKKNYNLDYTMVGIYVEELNTGYSWVYGNELVKDTTTGKTKGKFSVASAVKLPMAFSTLKYMEENKIKLDSTFKDSLSGKTLVLKDVLANAVSRSINSNFNYLLRYMGVVKTNEYLEKYGILNSTVNAELGGADPYWTESRILKEYGTLTNSRLTPEDYGLILKEVYNGVNEDNIYMTYLNKILLENINSDRIPLAINYKYPVAHKTGTFSQKGKFADVGIVYIPNKPYIIAIMTDYQKNTGNCVPFIRAFTKEFNSYMEKR